MFREGYFSSQEGTNSFCFFLGGGRHWNPFKDLRLGFDSLGIRPSKLQILHIITHLIAWFSSVTTQNQTNQLPNQIPKNKHPNNHPQQPSKNQQPSTHNPQTKSKSCLKQRTTQPTIHNPHQSPTVSSLKNPKVLMLLCSGCVVTLSRCPAMGLVLSRTKEGVTKLPGVHFQVWVFPSVF